MSISGGGDGATSAAKAAAALKKGPWSAAEDATLMDYVKAHGEGNWNAVQKFSSLRRCGKSCRLRWANHLRPNLKKGSFSRDEELLILKLHAELGNKWARMASQLPGRTDNEIKNYWNTRVKRRTRAGLPLYPPEIEPAPAVTGKQFRSKPVLDLSAIKGFRADGLTFQLPISPFSPQTPPPIFHHQIHPLLQQQQFHHQQQPMKQQQFQHQQQQMMMHRGFDNIGMNIIPPRPFSINTELPSIQFNQFNDGVFLDKMLRGSYGDIFIKGDEDSKIRDAYNGNNMKSEPNDISNMQSSVMVDVGNNLQEIQQNPPSISHETQFGMDYWNNC